MNCYVYLHIHAGPEGPVVFYVGKGTGRRAYDIKRRSQLWKRVHAKHIDSFDVLIFEECASAEYAFQLESELVSWFGRRDLEAGPLVNFTDGGEGGIGYRMTEENRRKVGDSKRGVRASDETRKRMSVAAVGRVKSPETREKLRRAAARRKEAGIPGPTAGLKQSRETVEARAISLKRRCSSRTEEERLAISINCKAAQAAIWTPEKRAAHSLACKRRKGKQR